MPKHGQNWVIAFALAMAISGCGGGGGGSSSAGNPAFSSLAGCGALDGKTIGGASITVVSTNASPYCGLTALLPPQTQIEMRLPFQWSKRYVHIGGGNQDGYLPSLDSDMSGALTALAQGDAIAASNGGHIGNPNAPGGVSFDSTWALNNTPLILDYEYAAIGTTDTVAKAIIQTFYGAQPQYSYFSGCSQGGREALNAAIHFPGNYDGVIAGAPVVSSAGLQASRAGIHNQLFGAPGNNLSPAKISLVAAATVAACDALDGVQDGIISNPDACRFDLETLRCSAGDNPSCLTDAQIQSVQAFVTTSHSQTEL
jgi:Tannase and feruloyl esterase